MSRHDFPEFAEGSLSFEPLHNEEAVDSQGENSKQIQQDHRAPQICTIKNDAGPECAAVIVPRGHAEKKEQNYPGRAHRTEEENVAVEQVASVYREQIDGPDTNHDVQLMISSPLSRPEIGRA